MGAMARIQLLKMSQILAQTRKLKQTFLAELAALAHDHDLPFVVDLGTALVERVLDPDKIGEFLPVIHDDELGRKRRRRGEQSHGNPTKLFEFHQKKVSTPGT